MADEPSAEHRPRIGRPMPGKTVKISALGSFCRQTSIINQICREAIMIGSASLLALMLLVSGPSEAGSSTATDRASDAGVAVSSDTGVAISSDAEPATPVDYVSRDSAEDRPKAKKSSILLTMLEEQAPAKKHRGSPFKDEESTEKEDAETPPAPLPKPGTGDTFSGSLNCTDESCTSCEGEPEIGKDGMRLHKWFCGFGYEAWIDQGVTINTFSPRDRSNFPVGFNNRSNEYQLNQAYVRLKRDINRENGQWNVGATVDFLYGTDSVYASSRGLEVDENFGHKWNAQQYGLAMPQCYMEVFAPWGEQGLSMKLGHFYTILGYETTPAPENFFYSHSYSLIYGEPVTETGFLGEKKFGNFKLQAGATRGWDNWEDNNNNLSFLGGISWTSDDRRTSLAFAIQSGPEQNEPPANSNSRNVFSLVYQQMAGERLQFVMQYDYGSEDRDDIYNLNTATWYSLSDYVFYTVNERWKTGVRFEWFHDPDGVRVTGGRQGADYFELTAGANWTPNRHFTVRPEIRYDWDATSNYTPFADASRSNQLILDCDVIIKF
jgi:hypothetical protein